MENSPIKSKAFLITFISVLLLLVVVYFMFKNKDNLFSPNSIGNKIFSSFSNGTNNTGNTVDTTNLNNSQNINVNGVGINGTNNNGTTNNGNTGEYKVGEYNNEGDFSVDLPNENPNGANLCKDVNGNTVSCDTITVAKTYECNDGKDNDGDGLIDKEDPGCHTDYNATNGIDGMQTRGGSTDTLTGRSSYDPTINDESRENSNHGDNQGGNTDMCPSYPLTFTTSEQEELDSLIRKFYLMAGTIKTEDDILAVNDETQRQNAYKKQFDELTNECEVEKANPPYTGPKTIKMNPYYQGSEFDYKGNGTNWNDNNSWQNSIWGLDGKSIGAIYPSKETSNNYITTADSPDQAVYNFETIFNIW